MDVRAGDGRLTGRQVMMPMTLCLRVVLTGISLVALSILGLQAYCIVDLRVFELPYLWCLLGLRGAVFMIFLNVGLIMVVWHALRYALKGTRPSLSRVSRFILIAWLIAVAWLSEWTFLETPLSVRLASLTIDEKYKRRTADRVHTAARSSHLTTLIPPGAKADERTLAAMSARVSLNRPAVFAKHPLGTTIKRWAERYEVSPALLFYWAYIDSFYGEAMSGPMPFFKEMTGETFRDLVQAHLPWWFVESHVRAVLLESDLLERIAGGSFGNKLRYALQKATYDVSVDPYDTNVFSDIFLVLREYKSEFPEIFMDEMDKPLARAFTVLEDNTLLQPYDRPYDHPKMSTNYYRRFRDDLITFSRAAFYRMLFDFDFATKVQALVARYYSNQYAAQLGREIWNGISEPQRIALLAMLRDVHVTHIGRVSYNLYVLPELNCTPFSFLSSKAREHTAELLEARRIWRPDNYQDLWAAAGFKLRVLSEVWEAVTGTSFQSFPASKTVDDSILVIARQG